MERTVNLTKRVVDAARPAAKDYQIWDAKVRGLGLRVYPSGAKSFILQYRNAAGRTRKIMLGRYGMLTVDQARDKAIKLSGRSLMGRPVSGQEGKSPGADGRRACRPVPSRRIGRKAQQEIVELGNRSLQHRAAHKTATGHSLARGLTKTDVARFQSDVAAGKTAKDEKTGPRGRAIVRGGKGIASRALSVLSAMMTFGEGRGIVTGNPTKGVEPFRGRKTERFLTETEVAFLGEALVEMERDGSLPWVATAAIKLLLLTGARRGEILGLRWEEVDLERGCLRLGDSKTGAKVIRLAAAALSLLAALPRSSRWVLPATKGSGHYVGLPKHWDAVRARANAIAVQRAQRDGRSLGECRISMTSVSTICAIRLRASQFNLADRCSSSARCWDTSRAEPLKDMPIRAMSHSSQRPSLPPSGLRSPSMVQNGRSSSFICGGFGVTPSRTGRRRRRSAPRTKARRDG